MLCVSVYFLYRTNLAWQENLTYNFTGVVENVDYDVKGIPEVTVHNEKYYLASGYNFEYKIERGDSIIKLKGSSVYKIIKHKSGAIVEFDNK